ncbi:LysR substrate-binding domain-containing protein [Corticibacterium sp. UT-5YL-CI-8]|nr:LysR substrate-binding domain-containing protein [Tianweitania sp. UT-5YL-CI-8]
MTKFQDMLAFKTVAELSGFTAAAKSIGVTTSSVTKSVTRLEESLGVQLFHRSTRAVHLTEFGAAYLERCTQILLDLMDAEAHLRDSNLAPAGTVRICLPPSFGRMTVVPALERFFTQYPLVKLELHLKGQTTNPIEGGYDLTVHSGRLADSRLVNRLLIRGPQKTVASPQYLEKAGVPQLPVDLLRHNCIVGGFGPMWPFGSTRDTSETVRVSGSLTTDSGDAIREAAIAGVGIAQATWWLFKNDIASGRLIPILESFESEAEPISIVLPAARRTPAKVRALVDFLREISREF